MSESFDRFLYQFHSQGREKLDGYDASHFRDMTDAELETAGKMLVDIADKDSTGVRGLGMLGTPLAIAALEERLKKHADISYHNLEYNAALWEATKDLKYQEAIAANIDAPNPEIAERAFLYLAYTTLNARVLAESLKLLNGANDNMPRTTAARLILRYYKVISSDEELWNSNNPNWNYVRALTSHVKTLREQTLCSIRAMSQSRQH